MIRAYYNTYEPENIIEVPDESGRLLYIYDANNYIEFNDELWRIISVESDGSLKIIRDESIGEMQFDPKGLRDSESGGAGGTYCANSNNYGCNAWAISEHFSNSEYSGTVLKDSSLNTYLNGTYYNSLNSSSKKLILEGTFNYGPVNISYVSLDSILADEKEYTWTGKIGLLNISDVLMASGWNDDDYPGGLNPDTNIMSPYGNYLYKSRTWSISGGKHAGIRPDRVVSLMGGWNDRLAWS